MFGVMCMNMIFFIICFMIRGMFLLVVRFVYCLVMVVRDVG